MKDLDDGSAGGSVFSLPLTAFERYMLADDRPSYPMTFPVRIDFKGTLNRDVLAGAFHDAIRRHPLLRCTIGRQHGRPAWIETPEAVPALVRFSASEAPPLPPGTSIDLRKTAGVVAGFTTKKGGGSIHFLFHHAACDGIGGLRFAGDVIAAYGIRKGSEPLPRLLPLRSDHLAFRGTPPLRTPSVPSGREVWSATFRESLKFVRRRPQLVHGSFDRPRSPGPGRMLLDSLSEEAYAAFCARAASLRVSTNDLMLRDLFLVVHRWNHSAGRFRGNGWIRVTMPTALMGRLDAALPAANTLGFAFITQPSVLAEEPERLLDEIVAETSAIRKWQLGAVFVDLLRRASHVPGLITIGARASSRFSTAVLSNLGDPARRFRARFPSTPRGLLIAGNLEIERIVGVPPVRPGTRVSLALFNYSGRLDITANADPRWISRDDAEAFLRLYVNQLEETACG